MTIRRLRGHRDSGEPPQILHVRLDEPGGAATHVTLLRSDDRFSTAEALVISDAGLRRPIAWFSGALTVLRHTRSGVRVVHCHGIRAASVALPAVLVTRRPLVVTLHGLHSLRRNLGWRLRAARVANRMILAVADRVLVYGRDDLELIQRLRLVRPEKLRSTTGAGFVARTTRPKEEARASLRISHASGVALWLGRFSPEKDPMTFVRAIGGLSDDIAITGILGGDGVLADDIRRAAREVPTERLVVAGWVDDVVGHLSAADVFVNTSVWEGLSLGVLEAAAAGLALVLSDCPGNREIARSGAPVALFPVGDAAALAATLTDLMADRAETRSRGDATKSVILREYSPASVVNEVHGVYLEVGLS